MTFLPLQISCCPGLYFETFLPSVPLFFENSLNQISGSHEGFGFIKNHSFHSYFFQLSPSILPLGYFSLEFLFIRIITITSPPPCNLTLLSHRPSLRPFFSIRSLNYPKTQLPASQSAPISLTRKQKQVVAVHFFFLIFTLSHINNKNSITPALKHSIAPEINTAEPSENTGMLSPAPALSYT